MFLPQSHQRNTSQQYLSYLQIFLCKTAKPLYWKLQLSCHVKEIKSNGNHTVLCACISSFPSFLLKVKTKSLVSYFRKESFSRENRKKRRQVYFYILLTIVVNLRVDLVFVNHIVCNTIFLDYGDDCCLVVSSSSSSLLFGLFLS